MSILKSSTQCKTTKEKVAYILHYNKSAQNCNRTLLFLFWLKFDNLEKEFETIKNIFHKCGNQLDLQNNGLTSEFDILNAMEELHLESIERIR